MSKLFSYLRPVMQLCGLAFLVTLSSGTSMAQWDYVNHPFGDPCSWPFVYGIADHSCGAEASNQIVYGFVAARAKSFESFVSTNVGSYVAEGWTVEASAEGHYLHLNTYTRHCAFRKWLYPDGVAEGGTPTGNWCMEPDEGEFWVGPADWPEE
jgi:hypothetical protein